MAATAAGATGSDSSLFNKPPLNLWLDVSFVAWIVGSTRACGIFSGEPRTLEPDVMRHAPSRKQQRPQRDEKANQ